MNIPDKDGIYGRVAEDVYHSDAGSLSVSGAKLLLPPSCPAKFRQYRDHGQKPKRVWDFGSLAHKLVLGEGADLVVVEAEDFRTKAAREQRDAAHEAGKVPVLPKDFAVAEEMAAKVLDHPVAGCLFAAGVAEHSMWWTDPETGVRLRGRADWITADDGLVDYKTSVTANPAELERRFWGLNYHMQHAWYVDGFGAATGMRDASFRFVVQEKEPPYVVTVVEYDAPAVAEGRRLNRMAIDTYARCVHTGEWPEYTASAVALSLPRWALPTEDRNTAAQQLIEELEGIMQ